MRVNSCERWRASRNYSLINRLKSQDLSRACLNWERYFFELHWRYKCWPVPDRYPSFGRTVFEGPESRCGLAKKEVIPLKRGNKEGNKAYGAITWWKDLWRKSGKSSVLVLIACWIINPLFWRWARICRNWNIEIYRVLAPYSRFCYKGCHCER